MKKTLGFASIALVAGSLTACGGGGGDYCDDLKAAKAKFSSIENGDVSVIEDAFAAYHNLADEAPSAVKDEWATLDSAVQSVEDVLKGAGLELSDLEGLSTGKIPDGVDAAKLQEVATTFMSLSDQEFSDATTAIEKHAKDECGVDLSADE